MYLRAPDLILLYSAINLSLAARDGAAAEPLRTLEKCSAERESSSSCRIVSGIFTRTGRPSGLRHITTVPRGALNLTVSHLRASRNHIVIRSSSAHAESSLDSFRDRSANRTETPVPTNHSATTREVEKLIFVAGTAFRYHRAYMGEQQQKIRQNQTNLQLKKQLHEKEQKQEQQQKQEQKQEEQQEQEQERKNEQQQKQEQEQQKQEHVQQKHEQEQQFYGRQQDGKAVVRLQGGSISSMDRKRDRAPPGTDVKGWGGVEESTEWIEEIRGEGPLRESVDLLVDQVEENRGITYSYVLLLDVNRRQSANNSSFSSSPPPPPLRHHRVRHRHRRNKRHQQQGKDQGLQQQQQRHQKQGKDQGLQQQQQQKQGKDQGPLLQQDQPYPRTREEQERQRVEGERKKKHEEELERHKREKERYEQDLERYMRQKEEYERERKRIDEERERQEREREREKRERTGEELERLREHRQRQNEQQQQDEKIRQQLLDDYRARRQQRQQQRQQQQQQQQNKGQPQDEKRQQLLDDNRAKQLQQRRQRESQQQQQKRRSKPSTSRDTGATRTVTDRQNRLITNQSITNQSINNQSINNQSINNQSLASNQIPTRNLFSYNRMSSSSSSSSSGLTASSSSSSYSPASSGASISSNTFQNQSVINAFKPQPGINMGVRGPVLLPSQSLSVPGGPAGIGPFNQRHIQANRQTYPQRYTPVWPLGYPPVSYRGQFVPTYGGSTRYDGHNSGIYNRSNYVNQGQSLAQHSSGLTHVVPSGGVVPGGVASNNGILGGVTSQGVISGGGGIPGPRLTGGGAVRGAASRGVVAGPSRSGGGASGGVVPGSMNSRGVVPGNLDSRGVVPGRLTSRGGVPGSITSRGGVLEGIIPGPMVPSGGSPLSYPPGSLYPGSRAPGVPGVVRPVHVTNVQPYDHASLFLAADQSVHDPQQLAAEYTQQQQQQLETDFTQYAWKISGFTDCSVTCGGGRQQTQVVCVSVVGVQVIVTDNNCEISRRPAHRTVTCNNIPCPPNWEASDWSQCSTSCDEGRQTRTVECRQRVSVDEVHPVTGSRCHHLPRLDTSRLCHVDKPCVRWRVGEWNQCSVLCGMGERTREVVCVSAEERVVAENICPSVKPLSSERCDQGSCLQSAWYHTQWSEQCAGECGEGYQSRGVVCLDSASRPCSEFSRPRDTKPCRNERPCGGLWFTGPWAQCSVTCGVGVVKRDVTCIKKLGHALVIVSADNCLTNEKPVEEQPCEWPPCPPQWFSTEWSECSRTCDTGTRTRDVRCVTHAGLSSLTCEASERPAHRQTCNTHSCADPNPQQHHHHHHHHQDRTEGRCRDELTNCRMVVQARLCRYSYYKKACCFSCASSQRLRQR